MENPKKTVLHDFHLANGANMALFGDYDMPLWYTSGAKAEHLSVIRSAGIFDTSHMATVLVRGKGARELLQRCFTKDLSSCIGRARGELVNTRCVYGLFLHDDGTVIDDAIICQLQPELYMVVVNAGMGGEIATHLQAHSDGLEMVIGDLTDRVGKMDIQGPDSARLLAKILKNPEALFAHFPYFSARGGFGELQATDSVELKDGTPLMLSRTGYTGEFGFELFVESSKLPMLWDQVLAAGEEFSVIPCGLAARDSLRAGAVLPLSHQDIGPWPFANTPWPFALAGDSEGEGFTKDFIGSSALLNAGWEKHTLAFAGFDPRKINVSDASYVTSEAGDRIGTILTCTTDMAIGRKDGEILSIATSPDFQPKGLCCGFVLLDQRFEAGEVVLLTDGKRKIKVEIRDDIRPGRTARKPIATMLS